MFDLKSDGMMHGVRAMMLEMMRMMRVCDAKRDREVILEWETCCDVRYAKDNVW